MAANKIKGLTLQIGGDTTELTRALSGVNKTTKDLQSELREVDKLLKMDPSNVELLAQKQKILADSVNATSDKLKTLKTAAEQAQEQLNKGEISEEQFRALQREVVKTEESLKKLEDQIKNFGTVFSQQLELTGKKFEDVGGKIEGAGKKMAGISAAAGGAIAGLAGMAVKAGQSADDINTLAKQTGLSTEEIQKFQYATDVIDVSLDTLTGSMSKNIKSMSSARDQQVKWRESIEAQVKVGKISQEQAEEMIETGAGLETAYSKLGVRVMDANGNLLDSQTVYQESIKALGDIENSTERDALAMEIFGKSAQDLNPLILGGADALTQLGDEAEAAGLILSQDALDSANEFNDSMDKLKATASGTFAEIGSEIANALIPFMEDLAEKLKGVMEWVRGLDSDTLKIIGTILLVVAGIAPLLIIIGKVITSVGIIISIIPKLQAAFVAVKTAVLAFNAVLAANPIGVVIAVIAVLVAALITLWNTNEDFRNAIIGIWENIKRFFTETIPQIIGTIINGFAELPGKIYEIGKNIISGLWEGVSGNLEWLGKKLSGIGDFVTGTLKNVLGIHSPSTVMRDQIGIQIPAGIAQGINKNAKVVATASKGISSDILNSMRSNLPTVKTEVGAQIPIKVAEGIKSTSKAVTEAAKSMFDSTKEWIDERKYYNELSLQDELEVWQKLQSAYAAGTEERKEADREVYKLKNELASEAAKTKEELEKTEFENSKKWIDKQKTYYNMSMSDELAAWQRVQSRYVEGTDKRIEADENVLRVKQEITKALKTTEDDYYNKVKETKDKLIAEEERLTKEYEKAIEDRAKSIKSFVGLFDEVNTESDKSGKDLLNNLEGQVDYLRDWRSNIDELASRGIDADLLSELTDMGPSAGNEIAALLDLTDSELSEYENLWQQKSNLARDQAVEELQGLKSDTKDQIEQLREQTRLQLEEYEDEFDEKISSIKYTTANTFTNIRTNTGTTVQGMATDTNTTLSTLSEDSNVKLAEMKEKSNILMTEYSSNFINKIIEIRTNVLAIFENMKLSMPQLGIDTIAGLMQGMESMRGELMSLARDIADSVADTMRSTLDIHSPSRVFDEIGKMTGLGLANGLYDSIRDVSDAMDALNSEINIGSTSGSGATNNNKTTNNTSSSNIIVNMYNTVRNDNDIKKISTGLNKTLTNYNRAIGVTG